MMVVFLFACYKFTSSKDTPAEREQVLLAVLVQGLQQGHFQPQKLDDNYSKRVYQLYLKRLDFTKKFLTQQDIDQLKKYETRIDDEITSGSFEFFNVSNELMNKRVQQTEAYYKEILAKPFDFETEESLELDFEKAPFAANETALKDAWRKYLKYQTMVRLTEMTETQESAKTRKDTTITIRTATEMEADARKKVAQNYDDIFRRLKQMDRNDRLSMYLNAIANAHDPHTEYYAPKDKENFDIQFSGRLEGIGATLQEKDGFIKVSEIVVGSPAYRQGELKAGDIIMKVAQGKQDPVDVENMRLDDAIKLIRGKKGTEVRLTVKKLDGSIRVIPIVRDVVIIEETYAQSMLIKEKQNIGYIKLPGFYADFKRSGGRNSADDVKKEVAKLKQEGAKGIILDLRNNGGGSLQDVVDMTGLFIEKGPVVQVKPANGAPIVLQDQDPSVQFDGPLVILVNENSASASEIMAAAIQDYKRGVIMGSTTFGKGTVQQMFDMDQFISSQYNNVKPLGTLKMTVQKFYRINGGTNQLRGVEPDIVLPDAYSFLDYGEGEQDYPLAWSEIKPVSFNTWKKPLLPLEQLKNKSNERVKNNQTFSMIREQAQKLKRESDQTVHSLRLSTYMANQKKLKEDNKKFEKLQESAPTMNIMSLKADMAAIGSDTLKSTRQKEFLKNLKKDVYVYEAVNVIQDQLR